MIEICLFTSHVPAQLVKKAEAPKGTPPFVMPLLGNLTLGSSWIPAHYLQSKVERLGKNQRFS